MLLVFLSFFFTGRTLRSDSVLTKNRKSKIAVRTNFSEREKFLNHALRLVDEFLNLKSVFERPMHIDICLSRFFVHVAQSFLFVVFLQK